MESKNIELITKMVIDAINQSEDKGNGFMVPIGVSARHVHLTQEHVEALFGPGYQLTKILWVDSLHQMKLLRSLV